MADGAPLRRSDRLLVAVFALIGAAAGLYWFLVNSEGPEAAVQTYVSPSAQLDTDATLTVVFFGRIGYTRTAPDAGAFDAEVAGWPLAALFLAVCSGVLGGGLIGYLAGRWLRRARH